MLILLPTNTCYGLAGKFTEQDYNEIYRRKGRDFSKPLALLVEDFSDMKHFVEISDEQIEFLLHYPYPWSFLGKRICELPPWMDQKDYQMLSLRVASSCLKTSQKLEYPLFLTSANISSTPESTTFVQATDIFPGIDGVDGGLCDQPPSDIFSFGDDGQLKYLRKNY